MPSVTILIAALLFLATLASSPAAFAINVLQNSDGTLPSSVTIPATLDAPIRIQATRLDNEKIRPR